jgi:poly(3-hydroxybutyrate) depolymerase
MRVTLSVTSCFLAAAAIIACSETTTSTANPTNDGGTGGDAGAPQSAEDVPVVALESDPATDCPGKYKTAAPAEGNNDDYSVAGQDRDFILMLPDDMSTPRPVFVGFNGTGETGKSFSDRAKLKDFTKKGFIVLAPSSKGNGAIWPIWDSLRQPGTENDPNKDVDYFDSLVKCVAGHHPIDKNRIYVGGHSAGGIFTNHLLQRRSEFIAGGIPASGVFSQTSPDPAEKLNPLFVIVTWGGDNDKYSGNAGGVSVGGFSFVSEASLASKFYDGQESVGEINCRGNNVGHAWLDGLNDWFADQLLAHPKGFTGKGLENQAPATPSGGDAKCTDTPYEGPETVQVECAAGATAGCQETCQLFADCGVENGTVGPALSATFKSIGFSGTNNSNCGGCVAKCEAEATTASDTAALECFKNAQATATCGQGIDGALPLIGAVNECCQGRTDSPYCVAICTEVNKNTAAASYFATCGAIAPK